MIDVMFFLLATFMLASLSMQNLHTLPVHLPAGEASAAPARTTITLTITADSRLFLDRTPVTLETLAATLNTLAPGATPGHPGFDAATPILIAADRGAPSGMTVQAMLQARAAGARNFLFAIQHGG